MAIRGRRYPARQLPHVRFVQQASVVALSSVSEVDKAWPLARSKNKSIISTGETDTAHAFTRAKAKGIGVGVETDMAWPLTHAKARGITGAAETDTAWTLGRSKTRSILSVGEVDTAWPIGAATAKNVNLTTARETDTAHQITPSLKQQSYTLSWWFKHRNQHPPYWSEKKG